MKNIRSYEHVSIRFPEGTVLFEGDIGSGKTSILMAIEFALFGNSTSAMYQKLLRKGATSGYVRVVFEEGGAKYEIFRSLSKKGRGIKNDESYVLAPDGKKILSATEIRTYFLDLMGISVSEKKRRSLPIVTYAIYTPQETMKGILEGGDEERVEVIRKIFKLDEYRIARDNTGVVIDSLKYRTGALEQYHEDIERIDDEISIIEADMKSKNEEIEKLKKNLETLKRDENELARLVEDMEKKRKAYENLSRKLAAVDSSINHVRESLNARSREIQELEIERDKLRTLSQDAKKYEQVKKEIENLFSKVKNAEKLRGKINVIKAKIEKIEEDIKKLKKSEEQVVKLKEEERNIQDSLESLAYIDSKIEDVDARIRSLQFAVKSNKEKLKAKREELEEFSKLGAVCPTCKRELPEEHKLNLVNRTKDEIQKLERVLNSVRNKLDASLKEREELKKLEKKRRNLELRLAKVKTEIENLNSAISEADQKNDEMQRLREEMMDVEKELTALGNVETVYRKREEELKGLEKRWREYLRVKERVSRMESLKKELESLKSELDKLEERRKEIHENISYLGYSEKEYDELKKKHDELRLELVTYLERLKSFRDAITELNQRMEEKKRYRRELQDKILMTERLEDMKNWLDEKFRVALDNIEKMRLSAINEEFRMLFEMWFNQLLEGREYTATVDENFKPVVRYEQYDMPLDTLSGGERTAVALAYRLALNTMVKRALGLKSNILILDEPTDGFSKDQLYRLKDIFDKMGTDQIIIVSHEKELRNLADVIFHVEKIGGKSKITTVS